MNALEAVRARQSWSKVTDDSAVARRAADVRRRRRSRRRSLVACVRGGSSSCAASDREALGAAIAKAEGDKSPSSKPLRAPLLIAVVASYRKSEKVPQWEQEAVASGVAHMLSLLLDEAGWGVLWRTGRYTRSKAVAKAHGIGEERGAARLALRRRQARGQEAGPTQSPSMRALVTRMPKKKSKK